MKCILLFTFFIWKLGNREWYLKANWLFEPWFIKCPINNTNICLFQMPFSNWTAAWRIFVFSRHFQIGSIFLYAKFERPLTRKGKFWKQEVDGWKGGASMMNCGPESHIRLPPRAGPPCSSLYLHHFHHFWRRANSPRRLWMTCSSSWRRWGCISLLLPLWYSFTILALIKCCDEIHFYIRLSKADQQVWVKMSCDPSCAYGEACLWLKYFNSNTVTQQ